MCRVAIMIIYLFTYVVAYLYIVSQNSVTTSPMVAQWPHLGNTFDTFTDQSKKGDVVWQIWSEVSCFPYKDTNHGQFGSAILNLSPPRHTKRVQEEKKKKKKNWEQQSVKCSRLHFIALPTVYTTRKKNTGKQTFKTGSLLGTGSLLPSPDNYRRYSHTRSL